MKRIIILGGGFSGVYAAIELERRYREIEDFEVVLVNHENFILFTPMLHEVASGELDPTSIVNPIHKLLRRVKFFCGSVTGIDLGRKTVTLKHGLSSNHVHVESYSHLVLSLGSVTHFYDIAGLAEHALTMKSLGDAMHLRNRMIACLEEADFECARDSRGEILTFVVAGGGFAGVETVAAVGDFLHHMLKFYRALKPKDIRVVLVHSGETLLPELDHRLGDYTAQLLKRRGIEVYCGTRVASYTNRIVTLSNGMSFPAETLVWTAGTAPNPLLANLPCAKERGKVLVDDCLKVEGFDGVWALGDCALIPTGEPGKFHPPTAQHAIREAKTLAGNIIAVVHGVPAVPFRFRTLGQLASLGRRRGVAQILGFRFSGFIAWWLWRTIYLLKLPRFEKRVRVGIDWTLDLFFATDNVQLPTERSAPASPEVEAPMPLQLQNAEH